MPRQSGMLRTHDIGNLEIFYFGEIFDSGIVKLDSRIKILFVNN